MNTIREDAAGQTGDLTPEIDFPIQSNYFEIFANRDPAVGIPNVYERVTMESGLVFTDWTDVQQVREDFGRVFYDLYGGFDPVILFDFEEHSYYKAITCPYCNNQTVRKTSEYPDHTHDCLSCGLFFTPGQGDQITAPVLLSLALDFISSFSDDWYEFSILEFDTLAGKLRKFIPEDAISETPDLADQWFAIVAVEKGEDGRELAINKVDTLPTAVRIAEKYNNNRHGYEKIIVRRQPDREIVWSSEDAICQTPDLPFDRREMIALLEIGRLALKNDYLRSQTGEKIGVSYDALVNLHDKVIDYLDTLDRGVIPTKGGQS